MTDLQNPVDWIECPRGPLSGLSRSLHRRRRGRRYVRLGSVTFAIVGASVAGFWAANSLKETSVAAYTCREVHALADRYVAGDVTEQQARQIETHLARCGQCATLVEHRRAVADPSTMSAAAAARDFSWMVALDGSAEAPGR